MSYRKRIRDARPGMSKSYAKIADFLLDSYIEVAFMTATELAKMVGLDAATVVRFSQSLDYSGYPDLLEEIRTHVKSDLQIQPTGVEYPESNLGEIANAFEQIKSAIEQTQISIDLDAVHKLIEKIGDSHRILLVAEGPAQPAAYNLLYFLEQGNFEVYKARPGVAGFTRIIHNATPEDLIIAIDFASEAAYIAPGLREARAKGVGTASISGAPSLPSTHSADIVLTARGYPDLGIEIIIIEVIIYVLVKTLQSSYPERFEGAREAISELSSLLQ